MRDTWLDLAPGTRVIVAMSGGVDSSVAAALLAERGCDVLGITMKNFCYGEVPEEHAAAACCSLEAIEDARAVARRLGIPHHVLPIRACGATASSASRSCGGRRACWAPKPSPPATTRAPSATATGE